MARRILLTLALGIGLAVLPVKGGNRAWEQSSVVLARAQNATTEEFAEGNATMGTPVHEHGKRYLHIVPGDDDYEPYTWKDGVIKYCFEDKTFPERDGKSTKEIVFYDLMEARELWYAADLPRDGFSLEEMDEETCKDSNKRREFLLISFNTEGKLGTTVGIPPKKAVSPGPSMRLSDSLEVGMLNVVPNYAHEMGHAWGLYHEHQNEAFWSQPYSESGGSVFGQDNWSCKNLKDYEPKKEEFRRSGVSEAEIEAKMRALCTVRRKALDGQFSAHDYLPITDEPVKGHKNKDVDWDSLMIYPSGAGGTGSASPGNDNRNSILLKPDGSRIPINERPSPRDVRGLVKLYNYNKRWNWNPLGSKSSSKGGIFRKIRREDPTSGCN